MSMFLGCKVTVIFLKAVDCGCVFVVFLLIISKNQDTYRLNAIKIFGIKDKILTFVPFSPNRSPQGGRDGNDKIYE